jgi:hypothetical protein
MRIIIREKMRNEEERRKEEGGMKGMRGQA